MRILALLLLTWLPFYSHANGIMVTNVDTGLAKIISVEELREYFLLRRGYYPNGVKVQVFLYNKDSATTRNFLLKVLSVSPSAYFDSIDSYTATGRSNLPVIVETDTRMVISVAVTKGGLGVVRDAAYAANLNNIKVIDVK